MKNKENKQHRWHDKIKKKKEGNTKYVSDIFNCSNFGGQSTTTDKHSSNAANTAQIGPLRTVWFGQ